MIGPVVPELEILLRKAAERHAADPAAAAADTQSAAPSVTEARARRRSRPHGRGLAIALAALAVTGTATAAVVRLAATSPPSYAVEQYLVHGNTYDCRDLASQALAQAVLRADPRDPNQLDAEPGFSADHDGIACPGRPEPRDEKPVAAARDAFTCRPYDARSARCPQAWRPFSAADYPASGVDQYDCRQFASQADAQAVLRFEPDDPNRLDGDGDGIACPKLPAPYDHERVATRPQP